MGADGVKEVTVVADHKHSVFEFRQIVFEPCHGVEVKVVGRFVKQQVVRISEKSLGEKHADFLVTAHVAHESIVLVFLDAETAKEGRSVAFGIPAFEFGEFLLQFRGADAVGIREIFLGIESVFLLHDIPEHSVTAEHGFHHRAVVKLEVVLFKDAHALAWTLAHSAVSGRKLIAENAHKSRFAGSVRTDYTIAVARSELEIHVLKEHTLAELDS